MKCNYRNCSNELITDVPTKLYCCSACKTNEAKYRQRLKKNPAPKVGRPRMKWVRWGDLPYKNKLTV